MANLQKIGDCTIDLDQVLLDAPGDPETVKHFEEGYEKALRFGMIHVIMQQLVDHYADAYDSLLVKLPHLKAAFEETALLVSNKPLDTDDQLAVRKVVVSGMVLQNYFTEILEAVNNVRIATG